MASGLLAPSHIIVLALVALLLFGPKRLPEMGRSLGHGLREFKDSVTGDHHDDAGLLTSSRTPSAELAFTGQIAPGSAATTAAEHDTAT